MKSLDCYTEDELTAAAKLASESLTFSIERMAICLQKEHFNNEDIFFTHAQREWRRLVDIHNEVQARVEYYEAHKAEMTE